MNRPVLAVFACSLVCSTAAFATDVSVILYTGGGEVLPTATVSLHLHDEEGNIGKQLQTVSHGNGTEEFRFDFTIEPGDYMIVARELGFETAMARIEVHSRPVSVRLFLHVGDVVDEVYEIETIDGRYYSGGQLLRSVEDYRLIEGQVLGSNGRDLWLMITPFLGSNEEGLPPNNTQVNDKGHFELEGYRRSGPYLFNLFEDSKDRRMPTTLVHSELIYVSGRFIEINLVEEDAETHTTEPRP